MRQTATTFNVKLCIYRGQETFTSWPMSAVVLTCLTIKYKVNYETNIILTDRCSPASRV